MHDCVDSIRSMCFYILIRLKPDCSLKNLKGKKPKSLKPKRKKDLAFVIHKDTLILLFFPIRKTYEN